MTLIIFPIIEMSQVRTSLFKSIDSITQYSPDILRPAHFKKYHIVRSMMRTSTPTLTQSR
ncbi:MAG: hypothetical protein OEY91_09700 [Nitrospirota bacterium]|nr:hypothetical protein [Nitrospirota bacterium]